jgi:uncharacterized membrane protein YgaE (UPF0421/DUF939 family)
MFTFLKLILELASSNRRILKTVLAAGLSWFVADELIGSPYPYFAPVAAIVVLQVTVAGSLRHSIERIVGVVLGVMFALALTRLVEINVWTLSFLILASLIAGVMLGFSQSSVHQLASAAILAASLGPSTHGFAWAQIEETIVGAVVAVVINAVISPYNHLPAVSRALVNLGRDSAHLLADLAKELRGLGNPPLAESLRERVKAAFDDLHAMRDALELAEQSLQWNYFGAAQRDMLSRYHATFDALEAVVVVMRELTRTLCTPNTERDAMTAAEVLRRLSPATTSALSELLLACARALERLTECGALQLFDRQLTEQIAQAERERQTVLSMLKADPNIPSTESWISIGAAMTDIGSIIQEMAAQAELWRS